MTHGRHIYVTASDMVMAKMCSYPPSQHELPHWKCVLHCCANCPCINLPDQESDMYRSNTSPSINFHIYHLVERCTVHGRLPLDEHYFFVCVYRIRLLCHLKNYTPEKRLLRWRHIFLISHKLLYSRNKKTRVSPPTHMYPRD